VLSDTYEYNAANQRTRVTQPDGSYWIYRYDSLGQVVSGKKYWSDNTPVAGQQFEYGFDDIGNRTTAKSGGDSTGANLRTATYTSDYQNRYNSRSNAPTFDVLGIAYGTSTVTVNDYSPYRKGEYFWKQLTNTTPPGFTSVNVKVNNQSIGTGGTYSSGSPENFTYDADGNLKTDSHWTYTWDGENRLIKMVANTTGGVQCVKYEYDWRGRRIRKQVWNTDNTGTTTANLDHRFAYDRWNLIAVVINNSLFRTFAWGLDLSGSEQGAGGVGGLLWIYDAATSGYYHTAYDGNGNVTGLVGTAGTIAAQYEYGPFGEVIRQSGTMAKNNPFRFSTKYQDDETDLLYYGYRYYNPSTGRWLSRDPLAEYSFGEAFLSKYNNNASMSDRIRAVALMPEYLFLANNGVNFVDLFGLVLVDKGGRTIQTGKFEIAIVMGHGSTDGYTWSFAPCSKGVAIMCYLIVNNGGNKDQGLVDLSGYTEENDPKVVWGKIAKGHDISADGMLDKAFAKIPTIAKDLCNCACKGLLPASIHVRFVWIPKGKDPIYNPQNEQTQYDGKNPLQNYDIPCG
jgi:RHS repeat-associated protein